jgi:hypothetical protein
MRCNFNEFAGGEIYAPLRKLAHGIWRERDFATWVFSRAAQHAGAP